jgi:hypothetical protein
MHASTWTFTGDLDELLRGYEAMVAEIPSDSMPVHLCLRAPDSIVVVDTCPSEAALPRLWDRSVSQRFTTNMGYPTRPPSTDYPVHTAIVDGERRITERFRAA